MIIEKNNIKFFLETNKDKFNKFKKLILQYNEKYGLTSIDEDDFEEKHFLDSLTLLPLIEDKHLDKLKIADVGCGAGFPSIPLLIVKPELNIDLIESNRKKSEFLSFAKAEFDFLNINIINSNVKEVKQKYDIVIFRAFSSLEHFFKVSKPILKKGTIIFAMKGKISEVEKEISVVKNEKLWNYISAIETHKVNGFFWERNIVEIIWGK